MVRLETKRLILRELEQGDAKVFHQMINDFDVVKWLLVIPHPCPLEIEEEFVKKTIESSKAEKREEYTLALVLKDSNEVIGTIGIRHVNDYNGTADIGYWIGKNYHRKGYMYEAAREVIRFAFEDLGLRRINIEAFAGNEASNGLIKKLGFEFEGTQKEKDRSKATGEIHDAHQYGLLKRNWKKD